MAGLRVGVELPGGVPDALLVGRHHSIVPDGQAGGGGDRPFPGGVGGEHGGEGHHQHQGYGQRRGGGFAGAHDGADALLQGVFVESGAQGEEAGPPGLQLQQGAGIGGAGLRAVEAHHGRVAGELQIPVG